MFRRGISLVLALAVAASSMPLSWCVASPSTDSSHPAAAANCSCCAQVECPCGCCELPAPPPAPDRPPAVTALPASAPVQAKVVVRCGCTPDRFFLLALTLFLDAPTETNLHAAPAADLPADPSGCPVAHFLPPDPPPPRLGA